MMKDEDIQRGGYIIMVLIVVAVFCVAVFLYNFTSQGVIRNAEYELACDKALEQGILVERINPSDCDVNWHGAVFQINFFCEKVMPSYCDFNLVALNETVVH